MNQPRKRNYRKHNKRFVYNEYVSQVNELKLKLEKGEITQKEFEGYSELLDEKYQFVR